MAGNGQKSIFGRGQIRSWYGLCESMTPQRSPDRALDVTEDRLAHFSGCHRNEPIPTSTSAISANVGHQTDGNDHTYNRLFELLTNSPLIAWYYVEWSAQFITSLNFRSITSSHQSIFA